MENKGEAKVCPVCGLEEGTPPESSAQLPARTVLQEKYLLGRVLGQGGFGITYLAWDLELDRKVAIKEYFPASIVSRSISSSTVTVSSGKYKDDFNYGLEKFLEEGKNLAKFQGHPGIVSVLNFLKANNTAYLVLEYVEGMTFEDYLTQEGGKVSFEIALKILMPVMDSLREVHGASLLHRDITPDNIYISEKGQVKLLDFGAARFAMGEHSQNFSIILKEGFAPMEQYQKKGNQGPWTDVYALGATFYRAITGKKPPQALDRLSKDELKKPSLLGIDISKNSEAILLKALAIRPEGRYKTIREFQNEITKKGIKDEYINCPNCSHKNKLPGDIPAGIAKCEKCGSFLKREEKRKNRSWLSTPLIGIIIICFLLPFLSAYCDGEKKATLSGIQLVTGTVVHYDENETKEIKPSAPAIIAILSAIGCFFLSFSPSRNRKMNIMLAVLSSIGLIALTILYENNAFFIVFGPKIKFEYGFWLAFGIFMFITGWYIHRYVSEPMGEKIEKKLLKESHLKWAITLVLFQLVIIEIINFLSPDMGVALLLAVILLSLYGIGFFSYTLIVKKIWGLLKPEKYRKVTPRKALAFLLIPFLNIFWISRVSKTWTKQAVEYLNSDCPDIKYPSINLIKLSNSYYWLILSAFFSIISLILSVILEIKVLFFLAYFLFKVILLANLFVSIVLIAGVIDISNLIFERQEGKK